jgi:acetate---CoA ligase (ADP-forming)
MARIILRDGRVAHLRKARNTKVDRERIRALFTRVSAESLYFRFFHVVKDVSDADIDAMISDSGPNGLALVCVVGDSVVAIGSYTRTQPETAEVAFLVDDDMQKRGLGSLLLEHLAEAAWIQGIKRFEAHLLHENHQMYKVFRASGFELESEQDSEIVHLVWPLGRNERSRALQEARERLATASSLHPFFHPKTIAVVGASRDPNRLGHLLFRHILEGEFQGTVYPVNPTAHSVAAVRAFASVADIPERIDLAVIVVPAALVDSVVDDCIRARVGAVMITSSGFADLNEAGQVMQSDIVRKLQGAGCRVIGPHSLGIIHTDAHVQLNASFAPSLPLQGQVAMASHSGALGIAILEYATRIGIGVSSFVSLGNRPDVSVNDLLQYWETDFDTSMILLYLESFGNPRKFSRITRRITRQKPILAVKRARTQPGLALSNANALAQAAEDVIVQGMFRQTGIIRVDTLQELFDVAALLQTPSLVAGRRVAVVTNTAGGAVITSETLIREGLELVSPVINLGFDALADSYRTVLPLVLRDESVDAVIVLFTPVGVSEEESVLTAISAAICEVATDEPPRPGIGPVHPYHKPVLANCLSPGDYLIRYIDVGPDRQVPIFPFPEQAVHSLAKVVQYHEYKYRDQGHIPDLEGVHTQQAREKIRKFLSQAVSSPRRLTLTNDQTVVILSTIGVTALARDKAGDIKGLEDIRAILSLRVSIHSLFGPVLELRTRQATDEGGYKQGAPSVRLVPLTDVLAKEVVEESFGITDIHKYGVDTTQLCDVLLRMSQFADEVPELAECQLVFRIHHLGEIEPCECEITVQLPEFEGYS